MEIDIGTLCTHCGRDTAFNSIDKEGNKGYLFVNRIPSVADAKLVLAGGEEVTIDVGIDGYMCVECQLIQCDMCDGMVLEYDLTNGDVVCMDCFGKDEQTGQWLEEKEGGKE